MFRFKPIQILFIISIVIFLGNVAVYAYDDRYTHPALTDRAISSSNLDAYLKQFLSPQFVSGVTTTISGNQIVELLTKGSQDEDALICRRSTHFHNPLQPWDQAGMSELLMSPACMFYRQPGFVDKYSALVWATGYEIKNGPTKSRNNQTMGWDNARSFYFSALTAPSNTDRDENFALTFRAVGQVLHLLQDMAVPAHVRNDFITSHLIQSGMNNPYELFVTRPSLLGSGLYC